MAEKSRTKIKKPKKSVIILLLVIVYICLVCLPYSRQGKASEETQQNFTLDEFFSGSDHNPANDNDTCRCKTFPGISADLAAIWILSDCLCRLLVYVEIVQTILQRR